MSPWDRFTVSAIAVALAMSAACLAILGARLALSGESTYAFLAWNLFLAWIPFVLASWLPPGPGRTWLAIPAFASWLLFFPNAPYLVTDFVHLRARPIVPLWYDLGMLCLFAWSGCLLGEASLAAVHQIVRAWAGRTVGALFVLASLALAGFGIYLGRFVRLNSWDVVLHPGRVVAVLLPSVTDLRALVFSAMFAAVALVVSLPFITSRHRTK